MDTETFTPDPSPWHPETDPQRLKVLGKASEETSELGSALARCIIQGIDELEPVTGKPNRRWLEEEIADVEAQIRMLKATFELNVDFIQRRRDKKVDYLTRWLRGLTRPVGLSPEQIACLAAMERQGGYTMYVERQRLIADSLQQMGMATVDHEVGRWGRASITPHGLMTLEKIRS